MSEARQLYEDRQGAVLLTTRRKATEPVAQALELGVLPENDGILFLLKRIKILAFDESLDAAPAHLVTDAKAITRAWPSSTNGYRWRNQTCTIAPNLQEQQNVNAV